MKNACVETSEAIFAEKSERAKKLYRYVSDLSRRIGESTALCRSLPDLFSNHNEMQRQKLRDNCEKLLFLDPIHHGKKSLDLLWRKVYYDTISVAKKLREDYQEFDNYLYTHIVGGVGHFHSIVTRIQTELKVKFQELDYIPTPGDEEEPEPEQSPSEEELQFGLPALHSCMIYLGDLSRYQAELWSFDASIAARYYLQAARIDMSSGMPYNQLGNLYLDKNYNLDSVCYYIHCLACSTPFEGAMGNLTKIFEKNNQFCESLTDPDTLTQGEHIQNAVAQFLALIEIWYLSKDDTNIPQRCNTIAQELKIAMDFEMTPLPDINKDYVEYTQAIEEENTNPSYFNGNLVHKMTLISLFTIAKLTEIDEQKAFACKAFTLALLSQLLQKLLKHLESMGFKNPAAKYKPRHRSVIETEQAEETEVNELVEEPLINGKSKENDADALKEEETVSDKEENVKTQNGDAKTLSKKALAKRRRRRRGASSESSDEGSCGDSESSDSELDESCSDEEVISDSSHHSDDSDVSVSDTDEEIEVNVNNGDADKGMMNKNHKDEEVSEKINVPIKIDESKELKEVELQNFLQGCNFLPSIKLLQDWVLNEKDLILSCGDSGESLFQCIVDLHNILTHYFKHSETSVKNCKILDYARALANKLKFEYKTIPLPEDINLRGTNICKFDKDAAEWHILDKYKPSVYEENTIRILDFIDFGDQIAKIVPRIHFNRSMKIYYMRKVAASKSGHKKTREWHNFKIKLGDLDDSPGGTESSLLRRLGRLWLASRVRELERAGRAPEPALLALDASTLHLHLKKVKQLLRARTFILLVPTVVVQELDDLKRDRSTARDAIRWLELQLKSGSRFLRAQRPGQSKTLPLLKYPRKAPPHVHNFIQILEFCNHFIPDEKQSQGGNGDPDNSLHGKSTPILILLIGNEGKDEEYKEFSLSGAAQSAGICVEHIGDFYRKWRQTLHKSGKKR